MAVSKAPLPPLPPAFRPDGEVNRWLARFKAARLEKWNVDRTKSLTEMNELAFYLEAFGRLTESLEVASFPYGRSTYRLDAEFEVALAGCLSEASYLLVCMNRRDEALATMEPLRQHPINSRISPSFVHESLQRGRGSIDDAVSKTDLRLSAVALLWRCTNLLAEWEARLPNTDWYPVEELRAQRNLAMEKLREALGVDTQT